MNGIFEDLVKFQANRKLTWLYKFFLEMLEDLFEEHKQKREQVKNSLLELGISQNATDTLIEIFDVFNESRMSQMRKRILDRGNDLIRQLNEEVQKVKEYENT